MYVPDYLIHKPTPIPEAARIVRPLHRDVNGKVIPQHLMRHAKETVLEQYGRISPSLSEHVKETEGEAQKLYLCQSGKPTIGYGYKLEGPYAEQPECIKSKITEQEYKALLKNPKLFNKKPYSNITCSEEEANSILRDELYNAFRRLRLRIGDVAVSKLKDHQLKALISIVMNGGPGAIGDNCKTALMEGNYQQAQAELDVVKANGKLSLGLINRRIEEMLMFGNGKLSSQAETRMLGYINQCLHPTHSKKKGYKTLEAAVKALREELHRLETEKVCSNVDRRQRLRNAEFIPILTEYYEGAKSQYAQQDNTNKKPGIASAERTTLNYEC